MTSKFSGNFWAENGYSVLEQHAKKGNKAIEMLASYLSERAKIEEEYAKSLQKLMKKSEAITEYGSLDKIWQKARSEMENECNLHTSLSQELKVSGKTASDVAADLKKTSKKLLSDAHSLKSEYDSHTSNINKSQQKYTKSCQELEKADQEVKEGKPKAQQKQQKAQVDKAKAEQEYQAAVQKLVQYQPSWEEKLMASYDGLQDVEQRRTDAVKTGWESFEKALKSLNGYIETFSKNLNTLVSSCDTRQNLTEWIVSNRAGTAPPQLPVFQPYGAPVVKQEPRKDTGGGSGSGGSSKAVQTAPAAPTPTKVETKAPTISIPTPPAALPPSVPPPVPTTAPPAKEEEYAEEAQEEYAEEEYAEEEYAEEYAEEYGDDVVVAAWDYDKQEDNEISFKTGERITIVSREDEGWWTGTNEAGETGMFPSNYVQPIDAES